MSLSIVIPVYNDVANLRECLSRIGRQDVKRAGELEVLVDDDGSREDIRDVFEDFRVANQNVRWGYIRLEENSGRFIARDRERRVSLSKNAREKVKTFLTTRKTWRRLLEYTRKRLETIAQAVFSARIAIRLRINGSTGNNVFSIVEKTGN